MYGSIHTHPAGACRPLHHGEGAENMRRLRGAPPTPFGEIYQWPRVMPRVLVVGFIETHRALDRVCVSLHGTQPPHCEVKGNRDSEGVFFSASSRGSAQVRCERGYLDAQGSHG